MKNTNTKEYKAAINKFLLDAINSEDKELTTKEDKINYLFDCFTREYCYPQNMVRYPSEQLRLKEWIQGLPSCLNIPFMNWEILKLAEQLHECKLTAKQEDTILENYFNHIANKLIQLKK